MVNMDFGGCFNGYFGDFCRAFVCGERPTAEQREWLKRAHEIQMRSLAAIRPGVTPAELSREVDDHPNMGHGIGIAAFEPPHMRPRDDYVIEPGMTFAVTTPMTMGSLEAGGVHLEDQVIVTDSGCEVYSTYGYYGVDD
jgi:Xaa-Pro aminopeptidase